MGRSKKNNVKARQSAKKLAASRKATRTNHSHSPSTSVDLNPKSTNTYDRPPSPTHVNHDDEDDISPSSTPEIATYSEVAQMASDTSVTEKPPTTTFHLCKILHDRSLHTDVSDDVTVSHGSNSKYLSHRLLMMFSIPDKEKGIDEDEAPLEAIRQINAMIRSLVNKVPGVKFGPWSGDPTTKDKLRTEFPEDLDIVERYIYDFNRFYSPGERGYCRLNMHYKPTTSIGEIESVIAGFRKKMRQFLQLAHSDAKSPVAMGSLTGSVKEFASSPDFHEVFKMKFKLSHLGLYWQQARAENAGQWTPKKFCLHYEIDRVDIDKNQDIIKFFNQNTSLVDQNFFGTQMTVVPIFTPFLDDEAKARIDLHVRKQEQIGQHVKSCTVTGVQITSWAESTKQHTLHRQLMTVESIHEKEVANSKTKKKFKGRLFYAIIPNHKRKSVTFYFSKANGEEARSVARCLPLFIRDFYKLEPSFFCSSDAMSSALEGTWDFKKRKFLTVAEADEMDKLDNLESLNANKKVYISKEHQQVMAAEGDDDLSVESRLTKGDQVPTAAVDEDNTDLSTLTGETRESKAKAYAAEATKAVAAQYIGTIEEFKTKQKADDTKFAAIERQLEAAMKALATATCKSAGERSMESGLSLDTSKDEVECLGSKQSEKNDSPEDISRMSDDCSGSSENNSSPSSTSTPSRQSGGECSSSQSLECPPSPYRKSQDSKDTFAFDSSSDHKAVSPPKRTKVITPGKERRKNPVRSSPNKKLKTPATKNGSGISL